MAEAGRHLRTRCWEGHTQSLACFKRGLALPSQDDTLCLRQPHPMTDTRGSPPLTHHFRALHGCRGGPLRWHCSATSPSVQSPSLPFLRRGWQTPLNDPPASESLPRGPGRQVTQLVGDKVTLRPESQSAAVSLTHRTASPPAMNTPCFSLHPCY